MTVKVDDGESARELHVATVQEEQEFRNLPIRSSHKTMLESFITADEQVFIKLSMSYDNLFGKRSHFRWVYENMLPLLGKPFILFTPADVGHYLAEFEFDGEVYVLPAGVEKIMAYRTTPPLDFCVAYARAADVRYPQQWCQRLLAEKPVVASGRGYRIRWNNGPVGAFRRFNRRYQRSVQRWLQPIAAEATTQERDKAMRGKADALAKLFSVNGFDAAVWKMLQHIAGEENIYRNGAMTSRVGGFPAQSKVIEMPRALRGEAGLRVLSVYKRIVQSVQISTDPLFSELAGVFYEPMGEDRLLRRED